MPQKKQNGRFGARFFSAKAIFSPKRFRVDLLKSRESPSSILHVTGHGRT